MRRRIVQAGVLGSTIVCLIALRAWSDPEVARQTKAACASCHANVAGGAQLTPAGTAFLADKSKAPPAGRSPDYVGSARCKSCHLKQHKEWSATAHSKAHANLAAADEKTVAAWAAKLKVEVKGSAVATDDCVRCHVTGFQLAGGYPGADSVRTAAVAVVGCESCHGPGARHVTAPLADKKKFISRNITEKACLQCHTRVINPKFDFAEMKKKGVHSVAAATAK